MTEAEWLACADPAPMLDCLRGKTTDRKLRLFGAACCRRVWHLLIQESSRAIVEAVEKDADSDVSDRQRFLSAAASEVASDMERHFSLTPQHILSAARAAASTGNPALDPADIFHFHWKGLPTYFDAVIHACTDAQDAFAHSTVPEGWEEENTEALNVALKREGAVQCNLLRSDTPRSMWRRCGRSYVVDHITADTSTDASISV
jgi:hypothetical protein